MKKILFVVIMILLFVLTACGGGTSKNDKQAESNNNEAGIEVDKGLLSNTITLPLDFITMGEEMSEEQLADLRKEIEESGAKDIELSDDQITFTISKKEHQEMMDDMKSEIEAGFAEYTDSDDFVSFQDIKANKDFSNIDVIIDVAAFEEAMFEGFALIALGISSVMYQAFDGVDQDKLGVSINLIDQETNEVYETMEFPEILEDLGE